MTERGMGDNSVLPEIDLGLGIYLQGDFIRAQQVPQNTDPSFFSSQPPVLDPKVLRAYERPDRESEKRLERVIEYLNEREDRTARRKAELEAKKERDSFTSLGHLAAFFGIIAKPRTPEDFYSHYRERYPERHYDRKNRDNNLKKNISSLITVEYANYV